MREGDVVYYLHGDHPSASLRTGLGSTSLATTSGGALHSRQGYYPYGEVRYVTGELPTEFGFTGQRNEATIGLYDYHARWYDPYLGRFISADTIVPEPASSSDFNRYAYVRNNPHCYVDPTGHQGEPWWEKLLSWLGGDSGDGEATGQESREFEMFWPWELEKIDAAGLRFNGSYSPFGFLLAGNLSLDVLYSIPGEKIGIFVTPGGVGGPFFGTGDVSIAVLEVSDLPSIDEYSGWAGGLGGCFAGEEVGGTAEWGIAFSENSVGKKTQSWSLGWAGGAEVAVYGGVGRTMQLAEIDKDFQATVFPGATRLGFLRLPEIHINLKPLFVPH